MRRKGDMVLGEKHVMREGLEGWQGMDTRHFGLVKQHCAFWLGEMMKRSSW